MKRTIGVRTIAFLCFVYFLDLNVHGQDTHTGSATIGRDDTHSSALNLRNANGFWHFSGPRSFENGNNLSIMYNNGTGYVRKWSLLENGNLGIGGITDPQSKLEVRGDFRTSFSSSRYLQLNTSTDGNAYLNYAGGNSTSRIGFQIDGASKFSILNNGYVGIGTTNPVEELTIHHNDPTVALSRNDVNSIGRLSTAPNIIGISENLTVDYSIGFLLDDPNNPGWSVKLDAGTASHNDSFEVWRFPSGSSPQQFSDDVVKFKIDRDGNVGIGTTTPTEKLSVNGTIRSKEIICEVAPWPDYVFEPEYQLQPLSELKTYIEEEGHLPGIPSASEVQENGVTLAKMNALLLEKIEELTLHVIRIGEELEREKAKNQPKK